MSIKKISEIRDKLAASCKSGKYYINYGSNYKYTKQTMPVEFYNPSVRIPFEYGTFCDPNQYIKYLERIFRAWKKLPPETERRNHNPSVIVFDTKAKGKE